MLTTEKYTLSQHTPKLLKPIVKIYRDATQLYTVASFTINRSIDNVINTFTINFTGQGEYIYLNPMEDYEYSIVTGYTVGGSDTINTVIKGYCDTPNETITPNGIDVVGNFSTSILRKYKPPFAKKIYLDIQTMNQLAFDNWQPGDNLENITGATALSEIIPLILTDPYVLNMYDYRIINYRKEDYPLPLLKDLVEFLGGYVKYNAINGKIEIGEKYAGANNNSGYDFLYTDYGDIVELSHSDAYSMFNNAVRIAGISPDDFPELQEKESTEETTEKTDNEKLEENKAVDGYDFSDDTPYLVALVQGTEKAPSDPYIDEPPKDLIEKKFYNTYLHYEADPDSLTCEGGSYNSETAKYEDGVVLGYGGMSTSASVLTDAETVFSGGETTAQTKTAEPLASGEGKVGFPWRYIENPENASQDFQLQEGLYQNCLIKGKVIDAIEPKDPIGGAAVLLEFKNENNVWQWFKWNKNPDLVIKFYMPAGEVATLLGSEWVDISSEYESEDAPTTIPQSVIANTEGVFTFSNLPISVYNVTASYIGYDDNELEIEIDQDALDFLKQTKEGKNESKKYKLIDTQYYVPVYGKKAAPIYGGGVAPGDEEGNKEGNPVAPVTEEDYTSDAMVLDKQLDLAYDFRSSAGIEFANGEILYADDIEDPRIISEEIARRVALFTLRDSRYKENTIQLQLPHNPWLDTGMTIAVDSVIKNWSKKRIYVTDITTNYAVSEVEEGIWDTVIGIDLYG